MEPIFTYQDDARCISCQLCVEGKYFYGDALCHDDDDLFYNRLTGEQIAASRAYIEYLKYLQDKITTEIRVLKHYYSCLKMNPNFKENDYGVKTLSKIIKKLSLELTTVKSDLKSEKKSLSTFLKEKDKLYRKLENKRTGEESKCEN